MDTFSLKIPLCSLAKPTTKLKIIKLSYPSTLTLLCLLLKGIDHENHCIPSLQLRRLSTECGGMLMTILMP